MFKRIRARLRGYRWLDAELVQEHPERREVVCLTRSLVLPGTRVELSLPGLPPLSGRVRWQRNEGQGRRLTAVVVEGATLPFLPASEQGARQRRSVRFPQRLWVAFPRWKGVGALVTDLSLEGCRVAADLSASVGESTTLVLEMPKGQGELRTTARVQWSHGGEAGLRFLNLALKDEVRLAKSLDLEVQPPKQQAWEQIWNRSLEVLTYRVTRESPDEVSLDFETPNWLATFGVGAARVEGHWTGSFHRVEAETASPRLAELRSELGLDLEDSRPWIHLRLLDAQGAPRLEVWGRETSFRRLPREGQDRLIPNAKEVLDYVS